MIGENSITAVIPVHNRADLLERLLTTAQAQSLPFREMLVVDNASTDNAAAVGRAFGCRVLSMGRNAGFASAVNLGWRSANSKWVAILNSDVELDAHWAERLIAGAGSASFASGTLLSAADVTLIDGSYDLMSRGACAWRAGHGGPILNINTPMNIAIVPATACLYRRDVLENLGGFDETFGSYLEDVDLGLRCIRAGFSGVYVPDAVARHHGSATYGRWNPVVVRLISRNQLLLVRRHYDRALFRACLWPIIAGQVLWGLVALRHGAFGPWFAGKWEALKGFSPAGAPCAALREFLVASEAEIHARACTDSYWRWYFRLTAAAAL
ncbi:MAG: glycosyltransferase [Acidobacteriota bacterium]|nr:glycosyltransferase [Acidobacteriota bacterium]